jgi:hypothetical protein
MINSEYGRLNNIWRILENIPKYKKVLRDNMNGWKRITLLIKCCHKVWGNFLSLYSQSYEVTILKNTYATGERKMQMYFHMLNCVYNWNQIACLLCINHDLELIHTFSKLNTPNPKILC